MLAALPMPVLLTLTMCFQRIRTKAMAMEKAVLSSNVQALEEIIQDNITGLLFEKGNVHDLSEKLIQLIENSNLRSQLGKEGRNWVCKQRDWSTISDTLNNVYSNLHH